MGLTICAVMVATLTASAALARSTAPNDAYRFYRFKVDATAGHGLQLSEVKLFSGTTDVTRAAVRLRAADMAATAAEDVSPFTMISRLRRLWTDPRSSLTPARQPPPRFMDTRAIMFMAKAVRSGCRTRRCLTKTST